MNYELLSDFLWGPFIPLRPYPCQTIFGSPKRKTPSTWQSPRYETLIILFTHCTARCPLVSTPWHLTFQKQFPITPGSVESLLQRSFFFSPACTSSLGKHNSIRLQQQHCKTTTKLHPGQPHSPSQPARLNRVERGANPHNQPANTIKGRKKRRSRKLLFN